jgi:hypothetical protein
MIPGAARLNAAVPDEKSSERRDNRIVFLSQPCRRAQADSQSSIQAQRWAVFQIRARLLPDHEK